MEWRAAFFSAATPTTSTDPVIATDWLAFTADETDFLTALTDLLGSNTYGPNAYVAGPDYAQGADEPIPQMIWQRGILVTLPAEIPNFPVTIPPQPYGLNNRNVVRYMCIQVKAAAAGEFIWSGGYVTRVDWDTGDEIWNVPFGASVFGGQDIIGQSGVLVDDQYIVYGSPVDGTCYSLWKWEYTPQSYWTELGWVLRSSHCGTLTAQPPATDGDYEGELRTGTCA